MLGIRIPQLRKLAQKIIKEASLEECIQSIDNKYFEETILQGLVIAYGKDTFENKKSKIKEFIPKIDSWAICDTFVPTLKIKDRELENAWEFILNYINSDKEFEVRFAVIMMMDYFIIDKYVDNVIGLLDNVKNDGYYAKMGIAWCLAEIGVKYNEKLLKYLKGKNNLDKFTYNKTLQKMIESYRISKEQKIILKGMKIK